jgi:membrane protein implicated in regulation of membrane protease activity
MIEILIFFLAAITGLFITGFAVHMFIGGLVSPDTEYQLIAFVCFMVACAIGYMAWDVVERRRGKK